MLKEKYDIIVTRYVGIEGTAVLARYGYDELCERYPSYLVTEAASFDENKEQFYIDDVLKEVSLLREGSLFNASLKYAEEYTEFGIFEALFSMAKELKCGIRINIKDIPIKQETVEMCEFFKANPYAMYSGMSAVIVTKDGEDVVRFLEENGICAQIVGYTTYEDNDKIVINEEESGFLQHIRKDELKNILGRREYYERTNSGNC